MQPVHFLSSSRGACSPAGRSPFTRSRPFARQADISRLTLLGCAAEHVPASIIPAPPLLRLPRFRDFSRTRERQKRAETGTAGRNGDATEARKEQLRLSAIFLRAPPRPLRFNSRVRLPRRALRFTESNSRARPRGRTASYRPIRRSVRCAVASDIRFVLRGRRSGHRRTLPACPPSVKNEPLPFPAGDREGAVWRLPGPLPADRCTAMMDGDGG
jgi:hypothetical protein